MDDFRQKFIDEANDLLESLEEALFNLEDNPEDTKPVNEIFRVMHSLKGTGAMFGFDKLSSFTHELESLYDLVRSGQKKAGPQLIDQTFKSIDIIKKLIYEPDTEESDLLSTAFLSELKKLGDDSAKPVSEETGKKPERKKREKKVQPEKTFFIHFQPDRGLLKNGTHPLFLIDEIFEAGDVALYLRTDQLPELENIIPDNVYVYWDVLLGTTKDENFVRDIFIFVEDESFLEIKEIADFNCITHPDFKNISTGLEFDKSIDNDKLTNLVEKLKPTVQTKETEEKEEESGKDNQEEGQNLTPTGEDEEGKETHTNSIMEEQMFDKAMGKIKQESLTTIRVSSEKLDRMLDLISEMVTVQARLEHYSEQINNQQLKNITEDYQKLSRQLRENALDMRLIPIYTMINRFKRLVRDLSKELGKEVQFKTSGTETELDKSIIEKLYDPIMHIIRNSMDHGIEPEEERITAGKPPVGTISINTYYSGASVIINISDDGKGLDIEKIKKKAIERGLTDGKKALSEEEIINFIFQPGFTTNTEVSDISGRGVGMDVVKKNISELRGEIEISTKKGEGTSTAIILPLTLSIIDGLLVFIGDARYIIPLNNIKRIHQITRKEADSSFDRIVVRENRQIPFVDLIKEFGEDTSDEKDLNLVVLNLEEREIGITINSIVGKYQAVIRPLPQFVRKNEIFSGASVLGDGSVALVMDTSRILNKYINRTE